jgi:hypothetical protein
MIGQQRRAGGVPNAAAAPVSRIVSRKRAARTGAWNPRD